MGIIEDITKQKGMASALENAKSRDSLTGLWNKETGTRLAQKYMQEKPEGENCVLMLLNMDNFGRLNEKEGTSFANAVLLEVADILPGSTSEQDLHICLGVDKFMLFIRNGDKKKFLESSASIFLQPPSDCLPITSNTLPSTAQFSSDSSLTSTPGRNGEKSTGSSISFAPFSYVFLYAFPIAPLISGFSSKRALNENKYLSGSLLINSHLARIFWLMYQRNLMFFVLFRFHAKRHPADSFPQIHI